MRARRIARDWLSVATGGVALGHNHPFHRLIAAWIAFNALYYSNTTANGDKAAAQEYARQPEVRRAHSRLMTTPPYRASVATLARTPVLNMKRPSAQPVQIASQNSAAQVITYIYQVRCNLVHGGKTPDSRRDRALCGASANVITALVEELL